MYLCIYVYVDKLLFTQVEIQIFDLFIHMSQIFVAKHYFSSHKLRDVNRGLMIRV
jgi:hypothetical protein